MNATTVAELVPDQTITLFLLVWEKEIRTGQQSGKPYLRLALGDRTGTIEARMWEGFEEPAKEVARDDFVKVQARVEAYRGRNQLIIEKLRRAKDGEVQPEDFLPRTSEDVEQLYARLREFAAGIGNPWLQQLASGVIEDPAIAPRLKRAPAAKSMHHAYLGGLLEHMVSLCGLCRAVAERYPEVDADLLLTGAILHDLGKLEELTYERAFDYSAEGQLLGHILLEYEQVSKRMDAIAGFPRELKTLVQHLLASHHGRYEFGSPKLPLFREAVLLHYLDDLDSKMAAMRRSLESPGEGEWSPWTAALERKLLRTDRYLSGQKPAAAPGAIGGGGAKSDRGGQGQLPLGAAGEKE
jgi:3'-5' exoribonuclease